MTRRYRMDRREFVTRTPLLAGAFGAAGLGWHPGRAAAEAPSSPKDSSAADRGGRAVHKLTHDAFAKLVGQQFEVREALGGATRQLAVITLQKIDAHEQRPGDRRPSHVRQQGYTLCFASDKGSALGQGTYTLDHAELGTFALFLVPQAAAGQRDEAAYEAVFN